MSEPEQPLQTYRGNCHCGAFVFELKTPEIKTYGECNCSICSRKGYAWLFPAAGAFSVVKGDEKDLTEYKFNAEKYSHKVWQLPLDPAAETDMDVFSSVPPAAPPLWLDVAGCPRAKTRPSMQVDPSCHAGRIAEPCQADTA